MPFWSWCWERIAEALRIWEFTEKCRNAREHYATHAMLRLGLHHVAARCCIEMYATCIGTWTPCVSVCDVLLALVRHFRTSSHVRCSTSTTIRIGSLARNPKGIPRESQGNPKLRSWDVKSDVKSPKRRAVQFSGHMSKGKVKIEHKMKERYFGTQSSRSSWEFNSDTNWATSPSKFELKYVVSCRFNRLWIVSHFWLWNWIKDDKTGTFPLELLQDVDVLLEVRDARAPFTSAQFVQDLEGATGHRQHPYFRTSILDPFSSFNSHHSPFFSLLCNSKTQTH